jgi:tetratricopeptide (TPR) repeat protein
VPPNSPSLPNWGKLLGRTAAGKRANDQQIFGRKAFFPIFVAMPGVLRRGSDFFPRNIRIPRHQSKNMLQMLRPIKTAATKLLSRTRSLLARLPRALAYLWRQLDLKVFDDWLSAVFGILLRVAGIILLAFTLLITWRIINATGYVIAPVAVPEQLEQHGFTGHVVALQLQDAIKAVKEEAQSVKEDELVLEDGEQEVLEVSVMGFQVSIKSIAYHLGQLLGKKQKQIGGEIVQSGEKLRYIMRFTDFPTARLESQINEGDLAAAMDDLLRQGALKLLEYTDPYRVAIIHYHEKNYSRALEVIRMIIAERPHERAWAYIAWGSTLQEQGQIAAAADKFRSAIQQDSANWLPYYRLATLAFMTEDFDTAQQWLEEVVRVNPSHTDALITLGWRYTMAGRTNEADSSFYRAIRSAENTKHYASIWQSWMESKFLQEGNQEAGLAIAEMALQAAEENADGYLLRGYGYIIQKDTTAAYQALEKAYQLDPGNLRAAIAYANANFRVSKDYEAVIAIEEAAYHPSHLHEGYANLLNISAMSCNQLGRHEQGIAKIRQALEIAPYASHLYTTLAECYAYQGDEDKFYQHLETALAKGFRPQQLSWEEAPYRQRKDAPRMRALLAKYELRD